jgi:hypothetical protein
MSGEFPTTMVDWMREMDRRVELLERRRQHWAGRSPSAANVFMSTVAAVFADGVAVVQVPSGIPLSSRAFAGFTFDAGPEVGVAAACLVLR